MKFKKGEEIEVRFGNRNYRKLKVLKDFDTRDQRMSLFDDELGQEFSPLVSKCKIRNKEFEMEKNWELVREKIKNSTIGRFPWKAVLGKTLTNIIQTNNINGYTSEETYCKIIKDIKFEEMMKQLPYSEQIKLKDKVRISVAARFGEKNSSDKLRYMVKR